MSRDVCGVCWCPIDNEGCGCAPKQSKAMRLAEELEQYATSAIEKEVAREVRDLIRESEALREDVHRFREDAHCERETRRQLERHVEALQAAQQECGFGAGCCYQAAKAEADEALMRQALDALNHVNVQDRVQIIAALRERLGETK